MHPVIQRLIKVPTKEERVRARAGAPLNPVKIVRMLSPLQAAFFFSGWLSWTIDACDYFAVSLSSVRLSAFFGLHNNHTITTAITVTVLLRPVGALIFGPLADRYGRKWPMIANLVLLAVFSFASAHVHTFAQFLAVRALFGIVMGGVYGQACSVGLENAPRQALGLLSGIMQTGYSLGYIISAIVNIAFVNRSGDWRILFMFGGVGSLLVALLRLVLPESPHFLELKAKRVTQPGGPSRRRQIKTELKWLAMNCWGRLLYGILLVVGLSFLAHASQDAYPIILQKAKLLTADQASQATIISMCGSIVGSLTAGFVSQYIGRRLTIVIYVTLAGLLIPAWMLPKSFSALAAGAFFIQFMVQGVSGVLPSLLQDMSPASYRATFPGIVQQVGVMITACSAQIETTLGDKYQVPNPKYRPGSTEPPTIPDLAQVSAIFLAIVCVYMILIAVFGPDYDGQPRIGTEVLGGQAEDEHVQQRGQDDEESASSASEKAAFVSASRTVSPQSIEKSSASPQT